jgi:hypothetical protein
MSKPERVGLWQQGASDATLVAGTPSTPRAAGQAGARAALPASRTAEVHGNARRETAGGARPAMHMMATHATRCAAFFALAVASSACAGAPADAPQTPPATAAPQTPPESPPHTPPEQGPPRVIPHAAWAEQPPLGYAADGTRRNLRAGETLAFGELSITVVATTTDSTTSPATDFVRLRLAHGEARDERTVREGAAFPWEGHRIAVVAIHGPGELGAGLTALEVATLASLPPHVAGSTEAGGADMRLRVPHTITHVTLHHTGSAEPLRPADDPVRILRNLQAWGARERNWWNVPYHYLIDLDGRVYEGRDWRYAGETNTTYSPAGHFLISVIGNYERQQPEPAQIEAIADLMGWAIRRFDLPLSRIGGHYEYAQTSCPGVHLRGFLEDGTLRRLVEARIR